MCFMPITLQIHFFVVLYAYHATDDCFCGVSCLSRKFCSVQFSFIFVSDWGPATYESFFSCVLCVSRTRWIANSVRAPDSTVANLTWHKVHRKKRLNCSDLLEMQWTRLKCSDFRLVLPDSTVRTSIGIKCSGKQVWTCSDITAVLPLIINCSCQRTPAVSWAHGPIRCSRGEFSDVIFYACLQKNAAVHHDESCSLAAHKHICVYI